MNNTELKPCPFECKRKRLWNKDTDLENYVYYCKGCENISVKEAITIWNRRNGVKNEN